MEPKTFTQEDTMKYEYKTADTSTLEGLKQAERLKAAGWKIISSGLFLIMFERVAR